jgi:glycopeptide antibiotics resistance protein
VEGVRREVLDLLFRLWDTAMTCCPTLQGRIEGQVARALPLLLPAVLAFAYVELEWNLSTALPHARRIRRIVLHGALFASVAAVLAFVVLPYSWTWVEQLDARTVARSLILDRHLIPLRGTFRDIEYFEQQLGGAGSPIGETALNVLLFVPLGVLAPCVWPRVDRWSRAVVLSLAAAYIVEVLQGILVSGTPNIDDMLFNALGALLGFTLWRTIRAFVRRRGRAAAASSPG